MNDVLQVISLTKKVKNRPILQDIDLAVGAGEILRLIGPNGAGKTTLLKIISGTASATAGSILFDPAAGIGILPESPALLADMNALQNLQLLASIQGKVGQREINQALERVGLDPGNKKPVRHYSLGMKQRLMLAQAIMERPRLLLLDEPTNGLDPLGIIDLRRLLFELAEQGTGIIIASHLLNEIERMCHRVAIISQGSIVQEVNLQNSKQTSIEISVNSAGDWNRLMDWAGRDNLRSLTPEQGFPRGILHSGLPVPQVVSYLQAAGIAIEGIRRVADSLEAAFLQCSRLEDGVYR